MKEIILTSSILILVITALRRLFRGKVRQSLIYGVWLLVALRLLIPVQFGSFRFSFLTPAQPLTEAITEISQAPVSGPTRQEIYQNIEQLYIQQGQPVSTPQIQQEIQTQVEQSITVPTLGQIATVVWLVGTGGMALWFFLVNLRFQRQLRRDAKPLDGAQSPIPVLVSEKISSPCLVGLFRPAIYLTPASAQPHTARHVLAHELTHYRHRDHIWSLVRCICLCIYWFDPLVWLAAFLSRRDCELACDEGALNLLGEEERIAYGKTLLEIVSLASKHTHLLQTATTMNETKRQLKERVSFIVKKPKVWISAAICLVLVCAICFGCAVSGVSQTEPDSTDPMVSTTEPTIPHETTQPTEPAIIPTEPTINPADPNFTLGGIPLTENQIQQVNDAFETPTYDESRGTPYLRPSVISCFFTPYYSQPEAMELEDFLKNYPNYTSAPNNERAAAEVAMGRSSAANCRKFDRSTVDASLINLMGITSQSLYHGPSYNLIYLEEYDAYYFFTGNGAMSAQFQCIGGEVFGDVAYLYSQDAILTLVLRDGDWHFYSHLPAGITYTESSTILTAEQIRQVNEAFYPEIYHQDGEKLVIEIVPISRFFSSYYSQPEEMDFSNFLHNFPNSEPISAEEVAAVNQVSEHTGYPSQKFQKTMVDDILMTYMGITSDVLYQETSASPIYLEAYDAYYNFTSDYGPCTFNCLAGEVCGDVAYLYSWDAVLTLVQRDGTWYIYSHMPLDSSNTTP